MNLVFFWIGRYRHLFQNLCDKEDKRDQLLETMDTLKYQFEQVPSNTDSNRFWSSYTNFVGKSCNLRLPGNEAYCTAWSLLVMVKHSCSKLYCHEVSRLKLFPHNIRTGQDPQISIRKGCDPHISVWTGCGPFSCSKNYSQAFCSGTLSDPRTLGSDQLLETMDTLQNQFEQVLSHRICWLNAFRKSTPPGNRQLIGHYY